MPPKMWSDFFEVEKKPTDKMNLIMLLESWGVDYDTYELDSKGTVITMEHNYKSLHGVTGSYVEFIFDANDSFHRIYIGA